MKEAKIQEAARTINHKIGLPEDSIYCVGWKNGAKSPEAKEYHTEGMYSKEEVNELIKLANAIITPACDILPETYNKEIEAYHKWVNSKKK